MLTILQSAALPSYLCLTVLSFVWGACIGSFLNVCIHRIPREMSVVTPRSFCPNCKTPIAWYYNIPVFSFIMLRGKCSKCGIRISPRYVLVEALVGILFLLIWFKFGFEDGARVLGVVPVTHFALIPIYWLMAGGLVLGTFVDFEHMIIPDRVTLGGIAAGLVLSVIVPQLHDETHWLKGLEFSAIGAATGWSILWAVGVLGKLAFKKDAMGFGDVKLIGAIGAFLGWRAVLFTIMLSSVVGALTGIALVALKKREMQSRIPYGPYIALAALLWILWGPLWWQAYLQMLTGAAL